MSEERDDRPLAPPPAPPTPDHPHRSDRPAANGVGDESADHDAAGEAESSPLDWLPLLGTVFLVNCTLTALMRWLANGTRFDGAGTVFSLALALIAWRWTLSAGASVSRGRRLTLIGVLVAIWLLGFGPLLLAFGFPT